MEMQKDDMTIKALFLEMVLMIQENWYDFIYGDVFDRELLKSPNLRIQKMLKWTNIFRSIFLPVTFICLILSTIFNVAAFLSGVFFLFFQTTFSFLNTSGFLNINQFNITEEEIELELKTCKEKKD